MLAMRQLTEGEESVAISFKADVRRAVANSEISRLKINIFGCLLNVDLYKWFANDFVEIVRCVNKITGIVQSHLICGD